ncbi:Signal transduction histidine kinase [Catalinimonas alkaloidigena]|uniref:histidine kinase n=1 Tax=Catalinimonas alkaloidigena TaxID=1075417 RepID=A0A1G9GCN3_9BACT|nr:two-component regulator propeller domain-containing protein [Catalinimonas alkaloidigena]SDK98468.1 Signal transduction histidine kinase [Catalinimonas alkaloidigena]
MFVLWGGKIASSQAQPTAVTFTHLSVEQGLSSTSVYCLAQTDEGFLWVGTQNGLHRFDGYAFDLFDFLPGDSTSLSNNWVKALATDSAGRLWVATNWGLNRYDRLHENFRAYLADHNDPHSLGDNNLWCLFTDSQGVVWVGTNNGLSRYDAQRDQFTTFRIPTDEGPVSNAINTIVEDDEGYLWVGTWGSGIYRFDRREESFASFVTLTGQQTARRQYVKVMRFDRAGVLWIGTQGNGLHRYDPRSHQYDIYRHDPQDPHSLGDNAVLSLQIDRQQNVWVGTYNGGISLWNDGHFLRYQSDYLDPKSLQGSWITSLLEDRSGIIWAGHDNGLSKFDPRGQRFLLYQNNPLDKNTVPEGNINVMYEGSDGLVWIGTWGEGLCSFDPKTQKFTRYHHQDSRQESLADNRVWGIREDATGKLWVATSSGLELLDKHTGIFQHLEALPDGDTLVSINEAPFSSLTLGPDGKFWIGTWGNGLYVYDSVQQTTRHLYYDPENPKSLSHDQIKSIFVDRSGTGWVCTSEGGLNRVQFDEAGELRLTRFMYNSRSPESLGSNSPNVVFEDSRQRIWIGTDGSGLSWFDGETGTFHRVLPPGAGAALNSVMGILEDRNGNLWLSTNRGIVKYHPNTEAFKQFDVTDGLQGTAFMASHCKLQNGMMMFGGHNGFNMFMPEQIQDSPFQAPVLINEFKLFNESVAIGEGRTERGKPLLTQPLYLTPELVLSYQDYVLSFGFAALDFTAPHKNYYAYMLEGFDDKWNYTDASQRLATYTNLEPGEYTFRVRGTNSDGVWSQHTASLHVVVTPPFWQTWWAYALYVVVAVLVLWQWRQYVVRRERLRNELRLKRLESEKLMEVDHMKTRFFTNISHEFRTPLTLILGPLQKKLAQMTPDHADRNEVQMMHRNAQRLLQLINQLLDISKLEAGNVKLEPTEGDLLGFLKSIVYSFSSLAEGKRVELLFESTREQLYAYFDRDKVEKIVSNLVSNAFKFTPEGGRVEIRVRTVGQTLNDREMVEIVVADTGIGIPADRVEKIFDRFYQVDGSHTREQEGTGIGLALTRELVALHGGVISADSELGKGSRFTVRLPLQLQERLLPAEESMVAPPRKPSIVFETEDAFPTPLTTDDEQVPLLLIVEDNTEVRRYIRESFDTLYRVEEAVHGQEGLNKAIQLVPDLIISDLMMPRMDGIELCRRLKTDERTSHIPVVLLTARASVESRLDGLETGADDYITKPFHPQELRVRVRNLVESRRKLRERFGKEVVKREVKLEPSEIAVTSSDERFLQNAIGVVEKHMGNPDFAVDTFEQEMALSKMQLYRKLKALTNQSPNEFIRTLRLKRAATLLGAQSGTVSEIAYEVGFNNLSYFSKCFKELFDVTPSEYASQSDSKSVVG